MNMIDEFKKLNLDFNLNIPDNVIDNTCLYGNWHDKQVWYSLIDRYCGLLDYEKSFPIYIRIGKIIEYFSGGQNG